MTTREIVATLKEMYDADVSASLISKVTDAVIEQVIEWQSRPLDPIYPIVYLDCIVVKVRQDKQVINKSIYLVLGINMEGQKELLGMWLSENEGSKFWLGVLTERQNRGVKDILIRFLGGFLRLGSRNLLKGTLEVIFPTSLDGPRTEAGLNQFLSVCNHPMFPTHSMRKNNRHIKLIVMTGHYWLYS